MGIAALAISFVLGVMYKYIGVEQKWSADESWNLTLAMRAFGMNKNGMNMDVYLALKKPVIDAMVAAGHLSRPPGFPGCIITGPGICRSDDALRHKSGALLKILEANSGTNLTRGEKQRLNSGINESFTDLGLTMTVGGMGTTKLTEMWSIQVRKGQGAIVILEYSRYQLCQKLWTANDKGRPVYFSGKPGRGGPEKGWVVVPWDE